MDQKAITFLRTKKDVFQQVSPWGSDAVTRLISFVDQGKTLRGSLILFTARALGKEIDEDILSTAAAIELVHAGLLIHDDIMDEDALRRGAPSIYMQYEKVLTGNSENAVHDGRSLATCVGDLTFFLAFELLSSVKNIMVIELCAKEFASVTIAQMNDVAPGTLEKQTKETILRTYRYKTGRYSFSMPMVAGAILAGANSSVQNTLAQLGEAMGILYQLRDDELGAYGDTTKTGKPVGSDHRSRKQTLLTSDPTFANTQKQKYSDVCEKEIKALPFSTSDKVILRDLLTFVSARES